MRKCECGCIPDNSGELMFNFLSVISVSWLGKSGPNCIDLQKAHGEIFQSEVMMSVNNSQVVHTDRIRMERDREKRDREEETKK